MDFGVTCIATCETGYQLSGNAHYGCIAGGVWNLTAAPKCEGLHLIIMYWESSFDWRIATYAILAYFQEGL